MSCITYHLEPFLRDEARALAGQGMSLADRSARTHTALPPVGAVRQPGAGCNSFRVPSQVVPSDEQIEAAFARAWEWRHGCTIEATITSDVCAMKRRMRRAA